jgi:hypothetical protein
MKTKFVLVKSNPNTLIYVFLPQEEIKLIILNLKYINIEGSVWHQLVSALWSQLLGSTCGPPYIVNLWGLWLSLIVVFKEK